MFGDAASVYLPRVAAILTRYDGHRYHFTPPDDFERMWKNDPDEAQRLYWIEVLQRANIGAVTSLLRTQRWIEGCQIAFAAHNLLSMAASLRGLIETAADTIHGLGGVPETLASQYAQIEACLARKSSVTLISRELEERLIHFLYARRLDRDERQAAPESHRALHVSEYNAIFVQAGLSGATELYALLCQFTHPAAHSVLYSLEAVSDGYRFSAAAELASISHIVDTYRSTLAELLPFGFNAGLMTLATLNYFSLEHLHSSEVNAFNLELWPLWRHCQERIKNSERAE